MNWHDEKEPAVYGPGERQREWHEMVNDNPLAKPEANDVLEAAGVERLRDELENLRSEVAADNYEFDAIATALGARDEKGGYETDALAAFANRLREKVHVLDAREEVGNKHFAACAQEFARALQRAEQAEKKRDEWKAKADKAEADRIDACDETSATRYKSLSMDVDRSNHARRAAEEIRKSRELENRIGLLEEELTRERSRANELEKAWISDANMRLERDEYKRHNAILATDIEGWKRQNELLHLRARHAQDGCDIREKRLALVEENALQAAQAYASRIATLETVVDRARRVLALERDGVVPKAAITDLVVALDATKDSEPVLATDSAKVAASGQMLSAELALREWAERVNAQQVSDHERLYLDADARAEKRQLSAELETDRRVAEIEQANERRHQELLEALRPPDLQQMSADVATIAKALIYSSTTACRLGMVDYSAELRAIAERKPEASR